MFDSDGLRRAAATGLVFLGISGASFFIWTVLVPERPVIQQYQPLTKREAGYYAGGDKCRPQSRAKLPVNQRQARADECAQAAEQDRIQQENLLQQARSVEAANKALIASYEQSRSSALQTVMLVWTLAAAFWTIYDGRRAINRQLRAYLTVEIGGLTKCGPGEKPTAKIKVLNVGQTPAYEFSSKILITFMAGDGSHTVSIPDPHQVELSDLTLGPGRSYVVSAKSDQAPPPNFGPANETGNGRVAVTGCITYRDVFNRRRITQFCHYYSGPDWGKPSGAYHKAGNRST